MSTEQRRAPGEAVLDRLAALVDDFVDLGWERDEVTRALEQALAIPVGRLAVTSEGRHLPGQVVTCDRCGSPIIWAVTAARASGPGGKAMPLDPVEHPDGNVAVQPRTTTRLVARVLGKDEHHQPPSEYLAMPHFATCGARRARPGR